MRQRVRDLCDAAMRNAGLLVHEQVPACTSVETLGIEVDGSDGLVRPTSKRLWKIYQALTCLVRGRWVNIRQLRIVLGHLTFPWCLNRHMLSIPHACYHFVERGYVKARQLWPSVLRELRWARDTLFLNLVNLRSQWNSSVVATDACESGFGVVHRKWDVPVVAHHGRFLLRGGGAGRSECSSFARFGSFV